jgi:hypothetical protein
MGAGTQSSSGTPGTLHQADRLEVKKDWKKRRSSEVLGNKEMVFHFIA